MDTCRRDLTQLAAWADYLPSKSFDVHAHLYRASDANEAVPEHLVNAQGVVGWQEWHESLSGWLVPAAPTAGLFFAFPKSGIDTRSANQFVLQQVAEHTDSRALLLVTPTDDPADVERQIEASRDTIRGFKVYHVYAGRDATDQAEIGEFLPEWAWELANSRELAIMLHIVRSRALADERNQQYLRQQCIAYPHAKLILAHAGRGFCGRHTVEGIDAVRSLDNVWFDTSAICEATPLEAILRSCGPSRLMFGSDFPVSEMTGRCVSIGDRFVWLDDQSIRRCSGGDVEPTLVGIESLSAIVSACQTAQLVEGDLELIFRDNARRLLVLDGGGCGNATQDRYRRAKQIIPGGTQLLSKRPEMYAPGRWPAYFREARGCRVIDVDGREYIDFTTSGIGSCLLGYADPDVCDAVARRVQLGSMSSLNAAEEVELAELLLSIHPWAEQVRYARTGGEAMAVAVRIARAATGRDRIAFCGYHGWSDWFLAANLSENAVDKPTADRLQGHLLPGLDPAGVPAGLAGTAIPFTYNRIEELVEIVRADGRHLAAVVMEPVRSSEPAPEFLQQVRTLADECGAVLVFDEITSGWRFRLGGAHLDLGVTPDMAVFAKAMSNGFPMAAVIGKRRAMEAAQRTFISSTYWTECIGPTAALATIKKMQREDVATHVAGIGRSFRRRFEEIAARHDVQVKLTGRDALLHIAFDHPEPGAIGTLFTVRMLERGYLTGPGFYPSRAHQERHLDAFFSQTEQVLGEIAPAVHSGQVWPLLPGPERQTGFARLTR